MAAAAIGGSRSDLLQEIAAPTWVYSPDTLRFLDVNDLAIRSYGWSRDEFLAMTIADIRPLEDVPALLASVARLRRNAGGSTGPWRHRDKQGAVRDAMVTYLSLPFAGQPARLIVAEAIDEPRLPGLSPRERQVFCRVARGHTSQEIAEELSLSTKSVETYRARFMAKLNLRNRADVVRCAILHGVLESR